MKFLSVCSGIEAASVAWGPLGWKAWAFSEFDRNPSQVLAHHYPSTPNLGDMTKFQEWPNADLDLLCGGTPCQSFSLSGLRKGLADPRGNLMLTFGAIAARYRPRWLVWENVPGVLSSNGGRDFGAFLGLLGELGYGFAYRVLDAQFFGVPQRRERVFVVGYLGSWGPPAAVLFERDSLRRHPSTRRKAGGGNPGPVAACLTATGSALEGQGAVRRFGAIAEALAESVDRPLIAGGFSDRNLGSDYRPEIMTTLKASVRDYIGFSQRGLKENGSWQEGMMPSMRCEAPVVMSGFAGFHGGVAPSSDVVPTLASASAGSLIVGGAGNRQPAIGFTNTTTVDGSADSSPTQRAGGMALVDDGLGDVRKLTPIECEILQGFPPGYTAIPTKRRNKSMEDPDMLAYQKRVLAHLNYTDEQLMTLLPDGIRYKALGNSWAVPNARWVGERIQLVDDIMRAHDLGLLL